MQMKQHGKFQIMTKLITKQIKHYLRNEHGK